MKFTQIQKINHYVQAKILKVMEFIYTPFKRFMPYQLFRYGVSGASNVVFDWVLFFVFYNFIFCHQVVHIGQIAISAHIASFVFTFPITFTSGFWLSRYISFKESEQRRRSQLAKYLLVVFSCILINYVGLKFFVEYCAFYPTPSKMIITVITTIFSYLMQKYFTFKA